MVSSDCDDARSSGGASASTSSTAAESQAANMGPCRHWTGSRSQVKLSAVTHAWSSRRIGSRHCAAKSTRQWP